MSGTRISSLLGKITVLVIICCCSLSAHAKYGGGTGEPNDPYLIYTAGQMNEIGLSGNWDDWDKHFLLMADIDLSAYTGTSFNIIGTHWTSPFTGVFDGNDHTISNFTYTSTGTNYIGLFGYVYAPNAEIKNLGLIGPDVDAGTGYYVGSLVGYLREGIIRNCYAEGGSVAGYQYVGGLVGCNRSTINNSYSTSSASGNESVGGLVGRNGGTITNCYSTGSISGGVYSEDLGGLIGSNGGNGSINNCYSAGSVAGDDEVGGLVGDNSGTITNCYSLGSVAGDNEVGGLVGYNKGTITNSYSEGDVSGDRRVGGLVGENLDGTITNSYSTGSVSGDGLVGGLVGYNVLDGTISNCYSTGSVSGTRWSTGGLVGSNDGTISNCYSESDVSGNERVGGLVGAHYEGTISNCYSTGSVEGTTDVDGLVGSNDGTISNCYSTGHVSGTTDVGGLVGWNDGTVFTSFWDIEASGQTTSAAGTGKTTAEMKTASTFALVGWGCGAVWTIDEGKDYPRLAWEEIPGELITAASYGGGSGEPNDPYLIYTAEQLNTIGLFTCHWDKHFKLCADIDLSGFTGTSFNIIGYFVNLDDNKPFTGVFDGSGHTISNFTYTTTGTDYIGLFGYVKGEDAEIKNLGLIAPNVDAGTGNYVGSLVGVLNNATITDCYVQSGSVAGNDHVGGLVGYNYGTITISYSVGSVSGKSAVGGLVGKNSSGGTITKCYSESDVSGGSYVGGLAGTNNGTISDCYATGSVAGDDEVGGLVGHNGNWFWEGTITNCYSTGSVTGTTNVGGLVGFNLLVMVSTSFWDIETSGQASSDGGTGKTTAEMKTASTFLAWVCDSVWTIDEGNDYPRLWWENAPGGPITIPSYGGGSGEPNAPYLIYTAEQLNTIGLVPCHLDKHFLLCADIDMSGFSGTEFNIIGYSVDFDSPDNKPFTGVFDGSGHTISNFSYTSTDTDSVGLFGYVTGEINNFGLIYPYVDAGTGKRVGLLVGWLREGTIANCYAEAGSISGDYSVGGLVGCNWGTISNCYSKATVSGNTQVGGLVGQNDATISNCYSTGGVSGNSSVGGLVGYNGWYAEVFASFWDVNTSGKTTSDRGTGLPTAEMQTMSTFTDAGWDFVGETVNGIEDIWFIPQQDYPHLWWEGMQVSMKLTPRTLNCRSKGNWVKAHLTLPEGFTVADVDPNRPAVLHSLGFQSAPLYVFVNENELVEIEAAFEREAVCSLAGDWPDALTVAGFLTDGNIFLGRSKVRIIHPGLKDIEELALYWLNADCVQPDFCDRIDMNRDSTVNLLDYALLLNSQVEFVSE